MVKQKMTAVRANTLMDMVFAVFLALSLFYFVQRMTMFYLIPINDVQRAPYIKLFLCFLLLVVIIRSACLLLSQPAERKKNLRLMAFAGLFSIVWLLAYLHNRENPLYFFPVFFGVLSLGCIGLDYHKVLKVFVVIVGSVVLSAALCSIGGAIKNLVYWDWAGGRGIRSAWGIDYCTDMAAYYFFLCLAAWVAWDNVSDLWFLLPASVAFFISGVIVQSGTGELCVLLFVLLLIWHFFETINKEHHFAQISQKIINVVCAVSFPLFAAAMIYLMFRFHAGASYAVKINDFLHGRLALASSAYDTYGIHAFGSDIRFIGFGRGVTAQEGYNYIDSSYHQLLLCYGAVPLAMMCLVWPVMIIGAIKRGDRRLCFALALVAAHAVIEQRFLALDYNAFMILPFSVLSYSKQENQKITEKPGIKKMMPSLITIAVAVIVFALFHKPFLAFFRTLCTILRIGSSRRRQLALLLACMTAFIILGLCLNSFYHIIDSKLNHNPSKKKDRLLLAVFFAGVVLMLAVGEVTFHMSSHAYDEMIEADRQAVEAVKSVDGVSLYVDDLPVLYERKYGGISSHLFGGNDLARLKNIAVITDTVFDSYAFLNKGFYSVQISDSHLLYTDNPILIEKLSNLYEG